MSRDRGVVVWSDDLPPEDVIACEKIDVALPGVNVGGEGEPVKSVIGSSEDYVPPVRFAFTEFVKFSDGGAISHELGSLFCRIYLLVRETGET